MQAPVPVPVVVEFVPGTRITRVSETESRLPKTFVVFSDGSRLPVPSDQIVLAEDEQGRARLGFGGMSYEGLRDGKFAFWRVKDLLPEDVLSPDRGELLMLPPEMIASIEANGTRVWPKKVH